MHILKHLHTQRTLSKLPTTLQVAFKQLRKQNVVPPPGSKSFTNKLKRDQKRNCSQMSVTLQSNYIVWTKVPSTVNLGLTIHTGWTCQLMNETMVKVQLQTSLVTLLSKQLAKFRTRLAAANRANFGIHMKIIYFNTFSLSLFYYSQTQRFFSPKLLKLLYHAMADFCCSGIGSRNTSWLVSVGGCAWARCLTQPLCRQSPSLGATYGKGIGPLQRNKQVTGRCNHPSSLGH